VFRTATRQARVEMTVENPEHRLKPGMFIRAEVVLARADDAVVVPEQALAIRNDKTGVFVIDEDGPAAVWREAAVGIREGGRVQVEGDGIAGRVVVLGQQLVKDGSPVVVSGDESGTAGRRTGESVR
jgi:multidrug efflux pump subunit AcrA (membrane-fusion protein)